MMSEKKAVDRVNLSYLRWLTGICLVIHFIFSMVGWNNSILDHHGFRQSQTAITSYYFIKDGFRLAYETPVLGAPWSLPFEFPLYQAVVAWVAEHTGWPLDETGRGVSLLFFYALLFVLYRLMTKISGNKLYGYLAVALTLASPTYILWSRAFLMESTALFFCLLYLWAIVSALKDLRAGWIVLAVFAGVLGGLVKITTFVFALSIGGMLCLEWLFQKKDQIFSRKTMTEVLLMVLYFAVIPMAAALKWTAFADAVKEQNPLGAGMTSKSLMGWNFGDLKQRLFGEFHHVPVGVLLAGGAIVFFILFSVSGKQRKYFALFFGTFVLGPLLFSNLFLRHGYYWYANTVYLTASLAFVFGGLLMAPKSAQLSRHILIPGLLGAMFAAYAFFVLPGEINDAGRLMVASAEIVAEHTSPNGDILCYGLGWDSSFPYYAKRRALMDDGDWDLNSPVMMEALYDTGESRIQAIVVGPLTNKPQIYFQKIAMKFHLTRQLILPDKSLRLFVR